MKNKNTFYVLFYLRNIRENNEGSPLMMKITVNGHQSTLSLRRRLRKEYWISKQMRVSEKWKFATEINLLIEEYHNRAYQGFTIIEREQKYITSKLIIDYVTGFYLGKTISILTLWNDFIKDIKLNIGIEYSHSYYQKNRVAQKHFISFLIKRYNTADININHLRSNHILEFKQYLLHTVGHSYNTAIKMLQFLKRITTMAIQSGCLDKDPFTNISLTLKEVKTQFLTDEELSRIELKNFINKRLEFIRDLYVFCCYTGLSYSDMADLKINNLEKRKNQIWIRKNRMKTKTLMQIPLLKKPTEILFKYVDFNNAKEAQLVFNAPSNQKVNRYLKEIADFCNISKSLRFHSARHTFATSVTLQNGMSIETVSNLLGHTSIRTTQHYAKILNNKIEEEMNLLAKKIDYNFN